MLSSMLPPASSATSASLEQELDVWAAMDRDTWGLTADGAGMVTGIVDGPWPSTPENKIMKWCLQYCSGVQYSDSGVQYRDDTTTDKISHPNFDHNLIWNERDKFQSINNSGFYFRLCFDPRWPHVRMMTRLPSNWSLWEQLNCL